MDDAQFSVQYTEMPEKLGNPEYRPDDERYALGWLTGLREFFSSARDAKAHVVFTVSL